MGLQHDIDEPLSLKGLVELFHMLQDKYYEEYKVSLLFFIYINAFINAYSFIFIFTFMFHVGLLLVYIETIDEIKGQI